MEVTITKAWKITNPCTLTELDTALEAARSSYRHDSGETVGNLPNQSWLSIQADTKAITLTYTLEKSE